MTINKINKLKVPIFKVNPELNELVDIPMFEDKIAEANEVLRTVGLPEPQKTQKKLKSLTTRTQRRTTKNTICSVLCGPPLYLRG